jgi:hypothetical protein
MLQASGFAAFFYAAGLGIKNKNGEKSPFRKIKNQPLKKTIRNNIPATTCVAGLFLPLIF